MKHLQLHIAVALGLLLGMCSLRAGQLRFEQFTLTGETSFGVGPSTATAPFVSPVRSLTNNLIYMGLVTNYNALGKWYGGLKAERTTLYHLAVQKEKTGQPYTSEVSKINNINAQLRARLPQMLELQKRINVIEGEQRIREAKTSTPNPQRQQRPPSKP